MPLLPIFTAITPTLLPFLFSKAKSKAPKCLTESAYAAVYFTGNSIYETMLSCGGVTSECVAAVSTNQWGALASAVVIAGIRIGQKLKEAKVA